MATSDHFSVITGATGLLGSTIAETLRSRGERVRALVRPSSDVEFLKSIGVETMLCDLNDPAAIRKAVEGASVMYHSAARVGEWGKWRLFREEVVDATRNVVQACKDVGVGRALVVSSVLVYGHRPRVPPGGISEDHPFQSRFKIWSHYGKSKGLAEQAARAINPEVTIVRPTWLFGKRDRNILPRMIRTLRAGWVKILGPGDNRLNIVHAQDVAEGAILAATTSQARGQAYHLCSEGTVTQRGFLDALADAVGVPRVQKHVSVRFAMTGGIMLEIVARVARWNRAPLISRHTISLIGRPAVYRIDKARKELGWEPRLSVVGAMPETVEWLRKHDPTFYAPLPPRY